MRGERPSLAEREGWRRWTRNEALAEAASRLAQAGIEAPRREAQALLRAAAGISALDLIGAGDQPLSAAQAAALAAFVARRAAREPLSRIVGSRAFWSLDLAISPDVLDPRADTETLVEAALKAFAQRRDEPLHILDLGTGSGALLCALLCEFPNARGLGVDISPAAAAQSRTNLASCGLSARSEIRVGDWAHGVADRFDLLVANPPYIASADIAALEPEVRDHDPLLALDGGADGLAAYRALAPQIAALIEPSRGRFFLELGAGQEADVRTLLEAHGLAHVVAHDDLSGTPRVLSGRSAQATASVSRSVGGADRQRS